MAAARAAAEVEPAAALEAGARPRPEPVGPAEPAEPALQEVAAIRGEIKTLAERGERLKQLGQDVIAAYERGLEEQRAGLRKFTGYDGKPDDPVFFRSLSLYLHTIPPEAKEELLMYMVKIDVKGYRCMQCYSLSVGTYLPFLPAFKFSGLCWAL